MSRAVGTVLELHRWPVKSLAGEPARALRVDRRGVGGDRAHALFDERAGGPRRLTVRQLPRMLGWAAAYPGAPGEALDPDVPPLPVLTAPDGARYAWDDAILPAALELRRFRTNVHVELDAPPFAEEDWEGRRLFVGGLELELLHPCERCVIPTRDPDGFEKLPELLRWLSRERGGVFGINARAHRAGVVRVGDPILLAA